MPDGNKEHWFQLCELAVVEKDPAKLLMLVQEICLAPQRERDMAEALGSRANEPVGIRAK